ncbi:HAMP domain-containing sensor histidine kinase [Dactylosporangium sp. AC04546]|uniref:HAMP domain-containing sensor histidine kinase n=1 Tax=Dactylosporangium sp. AC04546 TaxID=2862460 RepID=UPI001EE122AD|nr:HAMP domain-containing sensor histidine kinase [Dactylosporangium sp. AC04546]WVK81225.1 HAMP domain-containing sensor histidine kinase [Dactylosporangium sp. AC04546]
MRRPRLTVRVRLTLLYTVLFAACGTALIAITYGLLAANLPGIDDLVAGENARMTTPADDKGEIPPAEFLEACKRVFNGEPADEPNLRIKCQKAYEEGIIVGARTQRDATLDSLLWQSGLSLGAATLLAAVAGWFVAGRVLRPVHRLTAAARAASEHNLSARVALGGPRDELRELADTFDLMLERLQRSFDGQRQFIANASHELRTPLTVMRASVDVVLAKPHATEAELRRMARDIRVAVDHAETLIGALLTLARTDRGLVVREPTDLATVAEDVLDGTDLRDRRASLTLDPAPTTGDPVLLERLTANLVDNAVRYNVPGGEVSLTTSTVDGHVRLEVSNHGPVVAPEAVGALFQPFRRLHDRTGTDGFGLGLAIVASIAQVHGGTVDADPLPEGGLRVTVTLPGT